MAIVYKVNPLRTSLGFGGTHIASTLILEPTTFICGFGGNHVEFYTSLFRELKLR